jgi:hypothetical protein
MAKNVGIWLDHSRAIMVIINNHEEEMIRIESHADSHYRLSGGARSKIPYGPQDVSSERRLQEKREHQLQHYYQEIIGKIGDTDKIFIFGPGEARTEFEKEILKLKELSPKIASVEPADKMTNNQIVAKVRDYFKIR